MELIRLKFRIFNLFGLVKKNLPIFCIFITYVCSRSCKLIPMSKTITTLKKPVGKSAFDLRESRKVKCLRVWGSDLGT